VWVGLVPGGGVEPPTAEARRILSSQAGSEPLLKFSTLLDFSIDSKFNLLSRHDPTRLMLSMEVLQFYYDVLSTGSKVVDGFKRQKLFVGVLNLFVIDHPEINKFLQIKKRELSSLLRASF
jgi:hypothetical protein